MKRLTAIAYLIFWYLYIKKNKENNDARLKRSIELREEFSDIIPFIPFSSDAKKNCEDYLDALEKENYEICDRFFIEYWI